MFINTPQNVHNMDSIDEVSEVPDSPFFPQRSRTVGQSGRRASEIMSLSPTLPMEKKKVFSKKSKKDNDAKNKQEIKKIMKEHLTKKEVPPEVQALINEKERLEEEQRYKLIFGTTDFEFK